jgi:hypothetical protein
VSGTLNVKAMNFIRQFLFLAEPEPNRLTASIAVSQLADEFCKHRVCSAGAMDSRACRKHSHAVLLGGAKLIASGEVLAEMSSRGVVFVRLSPTGVLAPLEWASIPHWWHLRPELVKWARADEDRRRNDDDVRRWEAKV